MYMFRSIAAVGAGLVSMFLVVIVGTLIASSAAEEGAVPGRAYLAANLVISFLGAFGGGSISFSLAPSRPWLHTFALAGLLLILTGISGLQPAPGQPGFYPLVILLLGLGGVAAGGWTISQRVGESRREGSRSEP